MTIVDKIRNGHVCIEYHGDDHDQMKTMLEYLFPKDTYFKRKSFREFVNELCDGVSRSKPVWFEAETALDEHNWVIVESANEHVPEKIEAYKLWKEIQDHIKENAESVEVFLKKYAV